jgi:hypothetical protein
MQIPIAISSGWVFQARSGSMGPRICGELAKGLLVYNKCLPGFIRYVKKLRPVHFEQLSISC